MPTQSLPFPTPKTKSTKALPAAVSELARHLTKRQRATLEEAFGIPAVQALANLFEDAEDELKARAARQAVAS